jgi:hypothetical protein
LLIGYDMGHFRDLNDEMHCDIMCVGAVLCTKYKVVVHIPSLSFIRSRDQRLGAFDVKIAHWQAVSQLVSKALSDVGSRERTHLAICN